MNHRVSGQTPASRVITGYLNYITAEGLSLRTVKGCQAVLEHWIDHAGDMLIGQISHTEISNYLLYLRTEYVPRRVSGDTRPLALNR